MTKKNLVNASLMGLALLTVGCAKERPEEFVQGQGEDLLQISEYNGKQFDLTTQNVIQGESKTSSATRGLIIDGYDQINNLMPVEYVTDSPLFQGFSFRGLPGHKYTLQYEVTKDYLIINKVAEKAAIPYDELTSAQELENGLYKVPLIGYPIQLVTPEKVKNSYGEQTHQLVERFKKELSEASHFKIPSKTNVVLYKAQKKIDVLPSNFFEGEWFYAATIVSAKNATSIGQDLSVDQEANGVSRLEFRKFKDTVSAFNLNMDDILDRSDEINLKRAFDVPVTWVDYKMKKVNGQKMLQEDLLDDNHEESVEWKKRPFMKMDFSKFKYTIVEGWEQDNNGRWKPKKKTLSGGELQKLEISKKFISWTIWYPGEEMRIKFALRRAHKPLVGKVYRKSDQTKFGYFQTTKHEILNHRHYRDEDFEKLKLVNRFYPKDGVIKYYFSTNTHKDMRDVGRRGIKAWNDAFIKSGSDIRVVLDESKDVEIGDIRYNILNIVDTKDGSGLLGYGPSISDTESGEIISATSNIYANPFREGLITSVRNYIKKELGKYEVVTQNLEISAKDSNRFTPALGFVGAGGSSALGGVSEQLKNNKGYQAILSSVFDKNEYLELNDVTKKNIKKMMGENAKEENLKTSFANKSKVRAYGHVDHGHIQDHGSACSFNVVDNETFDRIKNECSEVTDYIAELSELPGKPTYDERELDVIESCASKLIDENVLATLIHEIGHNLGLRHNFAGSNDPVNYAYNKDGSPVAMTSSVMDYLTNDVSELLVAGEYDIAAIKYGYAGKIEVNNGVEIADVSLGNKSIDEVVQAAGGERKQYKFCTDEHVGLSDPLCTRWDHGSNPEEVVDRLIGDFKSFTAAYGRKYDRAYGPTQDRLGGYLIRIATSLKTIHDQWRFHLAEFVGKQNKYLENYTKEQMVGVLKQMATAGGEHQRNHEMYYAAAEKAFNFLVEVANHKPLTCMVKDNTNSVSTARPVDFEDLKENAWTAMALNVYSCSDISLMNPNLESVGQIGYFHNDVVLEQDPSNILDYQRGKVAGLGNAKFWANLFLVMRAPMLTSHAIEGFAPNFADNPIWASELVGKALDRAVNGINVQDIKGVKKSLITNGAKHIPFFKTEKNNIVAQTQMIASALGVPGDIEASLQRAGGFNVIRTGNPNVIPAGAVVTMYGSTYLAAGDGSYAGHLVKARNNLQDKKIASEARIPNQILEALISGIDNEHKTITLEDMMTDEELTMLEEALTKQYGTKIEIGTGKATAEETVTVRQAISIIKENYNFHMEIARKLVQAVGQQAARVYLSTLMDTDMKLLNMIDSVTTGATSLGQLNLESLAKDMVVESTEEVELEVVEGESISKTTIKNDLLAGIVKNIESELARKDERLYGVANYLMNERQLSQEEFQSLQIPASEKLKRFAQAAAHYDSNKKEYESQLDLLTKILMGL